MTATLTEQPNATGPDEQRTADSLIAGADDPYWAFLQNEVDQFLSSQGVTSPTHVIRVLRRFHATTWAASEFERIEAIIFGGQIAILEVLSQLGPSTPSAVAPFYEVARGGDPEFFEKYSLNLERYLRFLHSTQLIQYRPTEMEVPPEERSIEVTLKGQSFLRFRTATRKVPRGH